MSKYTAAGIYTVFLIFIMSFVCLLHPTTGSRRRHCKFTAGTVNSRPEVALRRYIIRMLGLIAGAFCGLVVTTTHAADDVLRIPLAVGAMLPPLHTSILIQCILKMELVFV